MAIRNINEAFGDSVGFESISEMRNAIEASGYSVPSDCLVEGRDYETVYNFEFSHEALQNIDECDVNPFDDLAKIRDGRLNREALLIACLDGADDDRVQGWRDYVGEICRVASK
jgi:hypothetical protein